MWLPAALGTGHNQLTTFASQVLLSLQSMPVPPKISVHKQGGYCPKLPCSDVEPKISVQAQLLAVKQGAYCPKLPRGDVGCLPPCGPKEFQISHGVVLPDSVKEGGIAMVRRFLRTVLVIPNDEDIELCCGGLTLPHNGDLLQYTLGCGALLMVRGWAPLKIHVFASSDWGPVEFLLSPADTVGDLKQLLQERVSLHQNAFHLFHGTVQLSDNSKRLVEYGINTSLPECVLRLTPSGLRGGTTDAMVSPLQFVDVETGTLKVRKWAAAAPRWRITCHGLCLEGQCTNFSCDAYGQIVIMTQGFGVFNVVLDQHKCKCPICSRFVLPCNAAFNNCKWGWYGLKDQGSGQPPKECGPSDFREAGNAYHIFDDAACGTCGWYSLKFFTRHPNEVPPVIRHRAAKGTTCPITLRKPVDPVLCSDAHVYERAAITEWLRHSRRSPLTSEYLGQELIETESIISSRSS